MLTTSINESVVFFTYNDVVNGRLFYLPFETDVALLDFAELQLDADDIQPARFRFLSVMFLSIFKCDIYEIRALLQ